MDSPEHRPRDRQQVEGDPPPGAPPGRLVVDIVRHPVLEALHAVVNDVAPGFVTALRLTANLSDKDMAYSNSHAGTPIWGGAAGDRLPPWSVVWHLGG